MRLLHRGEALEIPLDEEDCYAHSYGPHVFDHVDRVSGGAPRVGPEISWDVETPRHVTTEELKRQFEERLEARGHRSSSRRNSSGSPP